MAGDAAGDLIGTKLGNYRVDSVLGQGGMSVMYRATDVRLGRKVALKVIGEHLGADAEFRERFVDEARNTSAIDHANIVPVYDFGELDGMLYIAMRLVDGSDLASRIGGEPMDPQRAMRLLEQVADALDTLHERGLVHLDMKPANVLVTGKEAAREHVYLADFGLTRRGATGHRTRGGDFLGSPTYAAPEHLRGDPLDGRTDQYALACVAYACLTGNPPFSGEVSTVIKGHLHGQPPPVSRVTGLPVAVDDAVNTGMAKDPEERYASCTELVSAVETALHTQSGDYRGQAGEPGPAGGAAAAGVSGTSTGVQASSPHQSGEGGAGQPPGQAPHQPPVQVPPGTAPPGQPPQAPQPPQSPPSGGRQQPPPGTPPPGVPQAPAPGGPQGPPPGASGPAQSGGVGAGYGPYGPPPGQPPPGQSPPGHPPPGQPPPAQPPYGPPPGQSRPGQVPPPGYGQPSGDPWSNKPPRGGGGNRLGWIIAGVIALIVILGTVLIIVFAGGEDDNGDDSTVSEETGSSAPEIPMGPDGSGGGSTDDPGGGDLPPGSIPVEPGH